MLGIRSYDDAGLRAGHPIGFAMDQRGLPPGSQMCSWVLQYTGQTFHLVAGAAPLCGGVVAGKTVSAS
jgi:branched-chain amino acid transport system substrate-binding protein